MSILNSILNNPNITSLGKSKGRSGSRTGSRPSNFGKAIARTFSRGSSLRHVQSGASRIGTSRIGSNRSKSSSVLGGLLKNKKSLGAGSGLLAKKGIFGKVGKFAVAGLAAYGTYKLAKSMSKGEI